MSMMKLDAPCNKSNFELQSNFRGCLHGERQPYQQGQPHHQGAPGLLFFAVAFTWKVGLPQHQGSPISLVGLPQQQSYLFVCLVHVNTRAGASPTGGVNFWRSNYYARDNENKNNYNFSYVLLDMRWKKPTKNFFK